MTAYYNEIDPAAAAVLVQLIADGVIAPGVVDTRSIKDVQPDDLSGFTQCHFFAGGGLWSVAARLAGWPDDRAIWTGSCPCQPFSAAGKGGGKDDPRHLWPDFHRLIRAARPAVVVGEQVAGKAGYDWLDGVRADLASEGYASRGVDIPACAVDAPHKRNRLYWVGLIQSDTGREHWRTRSREPHHGQVRPDDHGIVQPDAHRGGRGGRPEGAQWCQVERAFAQRAIGGLFADADQPELRGEPPAREQPFAQSHAGALRNGSWWADAIWLVSPLDGKARRSKPGIPFLVDGLPGRVDLWRVGGNAIVPILAAEVLSSLIETELADAA